MILRGALIVLLFFCGLIPQQSLCAALGEAYFQSVGDAETIPDNNITALAEDRAGFVWIGTPSGLIRYDGYRFRRHRYDPKDPHSISGAFIRCLLVARDGRLWVGTNADGLSVFDPQTERFERLRHAEQGLAHDNVRALAEDREGGVWIGTRAGLNYWHPKRPGFQSFPQRLGADTQPDEDRILALLSDRHGDLWVGSWRGLSRLPAGSKTFERVHALSPELAVHMAALKGPDPQDSGAPVNMTTQIIMSLFELQDGRIGIGTNGSGSWLFDPRAAGARPALQRIPAGLRTPFNPADAIVMAMAQPRENELWLGGFGGVAVVDPSNGQLLRVLQPDPAASSSFSNDQVRAFLHDRAGQIWLGGYGGGLQRHDPNNDALRVLHHVPSRTGSLSHPSVVSVLELENREIWVGTRQNGIDIIDPRYGVIGGFRPDPANPQALGDGMVRALAQTRDHSVWAGTLAGLYQFQPAPQSAKTMQVGPQRPGTFRRVGDADGLLGTTVRRLLAGQDGDLWIGSNTGLAQWRPENDRVRLIGLSGSGKSLDADIDAMAQEADGRLWIGSSVGLHTLAPGADALQPVLMPAATDGYDYSHLTVVGLLIDRAGSLWVDTTEGLLRIEPENGKVRALDAVSSRLGIAGQSFGANLLEDEQGRIWSQHFVYDPAANTLHKLSRADGVDIGTPWFRSYTSTRDGLLLFGGSKGLLIADPKQFRRWAYDPPLVATDLRVGGQSVAAGRFGAAGTAVIQLQPAANSIAVEFSALDYSAPERNNYAYKLEGYDSDWIEVDADRRVAAYTNLPPSDYRLLLRGSNREGVWASKPLALQIRVLPAWHQSTWFYAAALLGTLGVVYLIVHARTAALQHRQRELEAKVIERTASLEKATQALQEASLTDPLTGLRNRRYLQQSIEPDVALSVRAHQPEVGDLIFFMVDLDHFKLVNDLHGHAAGDAVLVQMAERLRAVFQLGDHVVRWGGEEFLCVANATSRNRASALAEQLRACVADTPFKLPDGQLLVKTCSAGFACLPFFPAQPAAVGWQEVVELADMALYEAKHAGRNTWFGAYHGPLFDATAGIAEQVASGLVAAVKDGRLRLVSAKAA